jgi:hypothetical protein
MFSVLILRGKTFYFESAVSLGSFRSASNMSNKNVDIATVLIFFIVVTNLKEPG